MNLNGKNALVFAATGAIGSAVARALAREGARLFLSGRNAAQLEALGKELRVATAVVDATDERQVVEYVDRIARESEGIDIVFNAIGLRAAPAGYARPATKLPYSQFLQPLETIVGSQFLTARTAGRHMLEKRRGSIVLLSASLSGQFVPFMAGITAACGAIEGLTRTLAAEFGPMGVRVNCVRPGGMPETRTIQETFANMAETVQAPVADLMQAPATNAMRRPVILQETASAVAFVASDASSGLCGQVINVCAGTMV